MYSLITTPNAFEQNSDSMPISTENQTVASKHLLKIIDHLEPIPFKVISSKTKYEQFLIDWREQLTAKIAEGDPDVTLNCSDGGCCSTANGTEVPEKGKGPSAKDYKVIAVDVLMITSEVLGCPIVYLLAKPMIFIGTHWVEISDMLFNTFLKDVGIRMNVDRLLAPDADFIAKLKKQIETTSCREAKGVARNAINFNNGTLDIDRFGNATLREHDEKDMFLYCLDYGYDPEATCPKWQKYLDEVIPEAEKQANLAEFMGSCFSNIKHEKILLLYGSGANGKSVTYEVTNRLFGKDNIAHNTLEEITNELGYFRGNLTKVLLNYAGEISKKVNPDALKKLASREPMNGRYVRGRPFEIKDYCRSAFNCNVLPQVTEISDGYFRRFLIIPFEITIPPQKRNPLLHEEIAETDLPGIMNWVIAGLKRLIESNGKFTLSPASDRILEEYREASYSVESFVKKGIDTSTKEFRSNDLYQSYMNFCKENEYTPVGIKFFSTELLKLGYQKKRDKSGVVYGVG